VPVPDHVTTSVGGLSLWLEAPGAGAGHGSVLEPARTAAEAAVRIGCTALWISEPDRDPATGRVPYEAYSLLGALATYRYDLHLGVSSDAGERRAPSILAKIVSGIDVISGGRGVLSLGADRADAADRLADALEVARAVLEDESPSFGGRFHTVDGAVNRPIPVQTGGVPLVVFLNDTGSAAGLVDVCARSADAVVAGHHDEVREIVESVAVWPGVRARPGDRVAVLGRVRASAAGARIVDEVAAVRDAGADGCLVGVAAPWSVESLEDLQRAW